MMWLNILFWTLALYALVVAVTHLFIYKKNKNISNVKDKVIVLTGGTSGIGEILWQHLLKRGAIIVFTGRSKSRVAAKILDLIEASTDLNNEYVNTLSKGKWSGNNFESKHLHFRRLNMSSLKACQEFCQWVKQKFTKLDILANNAGLVMPTFKKTEDDFEYTMGINHYAHYVMTHDLLPLLKATKNSRVVNTSSFAHAVGMIDCDDLEWKNSNQKYFHFKRYANSKLANMLFAQALAEFFENKNIECKSVSFHPGAVRTGFGRDFHPIFLALSRVAWPIMRSAWEGTQTFFTMIHLDYNKLVNGEYYDNCALGTRKKITNDSNYWKKFWNVSRAEIKRKTGIDCVEFEEFKL